jgi:hypothetical protein
MWGPSATCFDKIDDSSAFVADDDIAIGSVADRRLLSGAKQTFHFKGVRTVFDPACVKTAFNDMILLRFAGGFDDALCCWR